MPVEAQTVEYSYLGDGVSTVFGFPSRFLSNDDLFVALNGVIQVAGFTITGAGTDDGGEVTFTVPPGNLVRVMLVRNPSPSQLVDFENGQTVLEGTLDNALDKLTMIAQYLLRSARRSVRINDATYTTEDPSLLSLPAVTARLSKILAFDENGAVQLIDRAGFEQLMADAIAAAGTATAAAEAASTSADEAATFAQSAADILAQIQTILNTLNSATRREFTMTAGQTVINVGVFSTTALFVYYDGVLLSPVNEYTTASPIITLTEGAAAGALVTVIEFKAVNATNALISVNDLADVSSKKNSRQNLEITKTMTGPNAAASISADSRVVFVSTALTAPRVYTLPAANAVNPGEAVEIYDVAGGVTSTNTLTIQRAGADTINGGTSFVLNATRAGVRLVSDGVSKWVNESRPVPTYRQVVQQFTASGTYTPTAGMVSAVIECVGGGGGGGGSTGNASFLTAGGSGGTGAYSAKAVTAADVGASKAVTIGAAGAGTSNANGSAGGDTSVGVLCVAKGGSGGGLGSSGAFGAAGAGGLASGGTGDVKFDGVSGNSGPSNNTASGVTQPGASGPASRFGAGGGSVVAAVGGAVSGASGKSGGGGGGGMSNFVATNTAGGAGGAGAVVITELVLVP